jgi:hypothetical protein
MMLATIDCTAIAGQTKTPSYVPVLASHRIIFMSMHYLVLDAFIPLLSAAFFSFFLALDSFCNKLASASEATTE